MVEVLDRIAECASRPRRATLAASASQGSSTFRIFVEGDFSCFYGPEFICLATPPDPYSHTYTHTHTHRSPTRTGPCTLNAVGLLSSDVETRGLPPLAPPPRVCGEVYLTLPYLTLPLLTSTIWRHLSRWTHDVADANGRRSMSRAASSQAEMQSRPKRREKKRPEFAPGGYANSTYATIPTATGSKKGRMPCRA